MLQSFKTLEQLTAAFPDEATCVVHFRAIRWANGALLPVLGRYWRTLQLLRWPHA